MRNPLYVDPLERHDFDSFIVESFQRQRTTVVNKKSISQMGQPAVAKESGMETPRSVSIASHAKPVPNQER